MRKKKIGIIVAILGVFILLGLCGLSVYGGFRLVNYYRYDEENRFEREKDSSTDLHIRIAPKVKEALDRSRDLTNYTVEGESYSRVNTGSKYYPDYARDWFNLNYTTYVNNSDWLSEVEVENQRRHHNYSIVSKDNKLYSTYSMYYYKKSEKEWKRIGSAARKDYMYSTSYSILLDFIVEEADVIREKDFFSSSYTVNFKDDQEAINRFMTLYQFGTDFQAKEVENIWAEIKVEDGYISIIEFYFDKAKLEDGDAYYRNTMTVIGGLTLELKDVDKTEFSIPKGIKE
jgi:hypothetical protein